MLDIMKKKPSVKKNLLKPKPAHSHKVIRVKVKPPLPVPFSGYAIFTRRSGDNVDA